MPIGLAQQLHMIKPERKAPSDIGWLSLTRIFRFRELGTAISYDTCFNRNNARGSCNAMFQIMPFMEAEKRQNAFQSPLE